MKVSLVDDLLGDSRSRAVAHMGYSRNLAAPDAPAHGCAQGEEISALSSGSRCFDLLPGAMSTLTMMAMNYRTVSTSRREIDLATGILVGLRGCSERDAFTELVAVVQHTGIGLGSIARALRGDRRNLR